MDRFKLTFGYKIDLKNEKDVDKLYPIYVYIGQGQKRRYINTLVKCKLRNFNGKNIFATPNAVRDNAYIQDVMDDVKRRVITIIAKYDDFNFELYDSEENKNQYTVESKKTLADNFLMYATKHALDVESEGTRCGFISVIQALKKYGKIKYFSDLSIEKLVEFDRFLDTLKLADSSIVLYHSKLKSIIIKAIAEGYKITNPYNLFRVRKCAKRKLKYLEEQDLQKIIDFKPKNKVLERVRDLFVFQAHTGLAYSDAIKVSKEDIKLIEGKKYIVDKRVKTNQEYSIRLYPESERILEKYKYNLKTMPYEYYNLRLKKMAKIVGVREDLSSHMARHTFATIALNRGVPLAIVAKMLGHSSTQCTEIYAQYLQSTIQREGYDKLEDVFG